MATNQELYLERQKRMETTVGLGQADRVPIVPKMNFF